MAKTEAATEEPKGDQVPKKNINKAEQAKVWKEQTERTRLNFIEIAHDTTTEKDLRAFAIQFAEIIKLWQSCAKEENPTYHNIEFGQGLKLNLRQVFALLAEEYQKCILVDDQDRSPNRNGYDMSWLDDQTMNVLVQLACRPGQDSVRFGRDLMSGVRIQLDEMMLKAHSASYLEYHVRAMLENKPRSDWMADELYSFPPSTKRIVYFFNYTETHWTLLATDVSREKWTHTLYNSLEIHPKGATWNAAQKQLPLIEVLIQGASALPKPKRSEIVAGKSARQTNSYDCGVITVYNAVQLLNGRKPEKRVDAKQLRLEYVTQILSELKSGVSSNSADSFTPDSSGTDFSSANSTGLDSNGADPVHGSESKDLALAYGEHNTSAPVSGDAIERNKKDVKEHEGSGLIPACNDLDKPHMQRKLRRSKQIENLEEKKGKSAPLRLQGQSKDNELRSADEIIDPTSSLTSEEKAVLPRIRGPLSSKVVLEVLESIKSMSLEPSRPMFPTENIRIQIVPPEVWNEFDVDELGEGLRNEDPEFRKLFASKLKGVFRSKLFELFADYLTPPHSDLRLLNPQPDDNSIPETPQFVLLPFCRDSFWKMIVVTLTSTYCSCQIYEPGCDSGGQWDGLKDVLGQIYRAVFGVSGKRIRWDRFQTVDLSRKQARMKEVDSGVWILEYAKAWLMEYTKAVTHNDFLSDPMFGMKKELDTNVAKINFAKMLVGKDIWQSHDLVESAHEVPGGSLDVSEIFTTDAWGDDPVELEGEDDSDSDRDSEYEVNSISSLASSASDTGSEFESDEDQSWESEDASELEYDSESEVTTKLGTEGRCLPAFLPYQAEDWVAEDASQELDSPDAEDLGSSPRHLIDKICDEKNPEACATRLIGAEKVALLTFTREECEEILNRLGPKPKLECLSAKAAACLDRYREWMGEVIHNEMEYALSTNSPAEAAARSINILKWQWMVANSSPEKQALLLELYTDPRIVSYKLQYIFGQQEWKPKMFKKLGPIDIENIAKMDDVWGVYDIEIIVTLPGGRRVYIRYTGSATGGHGTHGFIGISDRIFNGHEHSISLGLEEVMRLRDEGRARTLFVHELCLLPGATYAYYRIGTFPIIEEAGNLQHQSKHLVNFLESSVITYENSIDLRVPRSRLTNCRELVKMLRPQNMPKVPWLGANREYPFNQPMSFANYDLIPNLKMRLVLESHFERFGKTYLEESDCLEVQRQLAVECPGLTFTKERVRSYFNRMIRIMGIPFSHLFEVKFLDYFPLLAAIKPYLKKYGYLSGPIDGFYQYDRRPGKRFEWGRIAADAQLLAPVEKKQLYTTQSVRVLWPHIHTFHGHQIFFEDNWDRITENIPSRIEIPGSRHYRGWTPLPKEIRARIIHVVRFEIRRFVENNHIKISLADKENVIIGHLPMGAFKVIVPPVAQQLKNDEGSDGSIGHMIRIRFGSLYNHLRYRVREFRGRKLDSSRISVEDWESCATLLPWKYGKEAAATKYISRMSIEGLDDAGFDNNDSDNDDDNDDGVWAQLEAAEPLPRKVHAGSSFSVANPPTLRDSMAEGNHGQDNSQAQPPSLFILVDPERQQAIADKMLPKKSKIRGRNPNTQRAEPKKKLRRPKKKQMVDFPCPKRDFAICIRKAFKQAIQDEQFANRLSKMTVSDHFFKGLDTKVIALLSKIQPGHKVRETRIRDICKWMFDELKPREELPESHHVKRVTTELWKECDLHIFFFKNPKQWAYYPSVYSLTQNLARLSFMIELKNRLAKLGINPTTYKMGTYLEVFLPEIHDEVEQSSQRLILSTLDTAKAIIDMMFLERPDIMSLEQHHRFLNRQSTKKTVNELVDEFGRRMLKSHGIEVLGKIQGKNRELYGNLITETRNGTIEGALRKVFFEFGEDQPHIMEKYLRQESSTFHLLPESSAFRGKVETQLKQRYIFNDPLNWLWKPSQPFHSAIECMYHQARRKLGLGTDKSADHPKSTSQEPVSSSFQLDKDTLVPPGWSIEDVNLVLLLRERDPPVSYKKIASQHLPQKSAQSICNMRKLVLEAQGTYKKGKKGARGKKFWTQERSNLLVSAVEAREDWKDIVKNYFPCASVQSCKEAYKLCKAANRAAILASKSQLNKEQVQDRSQQSSDVDLDEEAPEAQEIQLDTQDLDQSCSALAPAPRSSKASAGVAKLLHGQTPSDTNAPAKKRKGETGDEMGRIRKLHRATRKGIRSRGKH